MTLSTASRLKRLQALLPQFKVDGCIIENPVDLFYLTGLTLSTGTLVIGKTRSRLFVDGRYIEAAKSRADIPVELLEEGKISNYVKGLNVKKIGFDSAWTTYQRSLQLRKYGSVKAIASPLKTIRMIKDTRELHAIRKSAELNYQAFRQIPKYLEVGVTEKEVAKKYELYCLQHGAEAFAFSPIIAFGSNTAYPHHMPSDKKLKVGDAVLVDIGVTVDGYTSDMTRVLFYGVPKPKMRYLYNLVTLAQQEALKLCIPGTPLGKLDTAARKIFADEKMLRHYTHGLGHGLGLEVHEDPRVSWKSADKNLKIEEHMVFTVEPGLYLPKVGGIRYEDTVIITKTKPEVLYPRLLLEDAIIYV